MTVRRMLIALFAVCIVCSVSFSLAEEAAEITKVYGDWSVGQYVDDFGDPTGQSYLFTRASGTFTNTATSGSDLKVIVYYDRQQFTVRLLEYNETKAVYYDNSAITFKFKVDNTVYEHSLYPTAPPNGDIIVSDSAENYTVLNSYASATEKAAALFQPRRFERSALSQLVHFLSGGTDVRCVMYIDSSKYSFTISSNGFGDAVFGETYDAAVRLMESGSYQEAMDAFRSCGNYKDSSEKVKECIARTYGPLADEIERLQTEQSLSLTEAVAAIKASPSGQANTGPESFLEELEQLIRCEGLYLDQAPVYGSKEYLLRVAFTVSGGEVHANISFDAYSGTITDDVITLLPEDDEYLCRIDAVRHLEGSEDKDLSFYLSETKALCKEVGKPSSYDTTCVRVPLDYVEAKAAAEKEKEEAARKAEEEAARKTAEEEQAAKEAAEQEKAYKELHSYASVGQFSEGLCRVKRGSKYGFVNPQGELVIPAVYDYAEDFHEGRALVYTGVKGGYKTDWYRDREGKCGYIDREGNEVVPLVWDYSDGFSQGRAWVAKGDLWGYIDPDGNEVIPCEYSRAGSFTEENLAWVVKNEKVGYINTDGELVIPLKYDPSFGSGFDFSEGFAVVWSKKKAAFIDPSGKILEKKWYSAVGSFHDGMADVCDNRGKYGFIDTAGKLRIKCIYEFAYNFSGGLCRVESKDGKQHLIDRDGREVLTGHWSELTDFKDGFAAAVDYDTKKVSIISAEGKRVADCKTQGSLKENLGDGYFKFYQNKNGYILVNAAGEIVMDRLRDLKYGEGLFTVLDDQNFLHIYDSSLNPLF